MARVVLDVPTIRDDTQHFDCLFALWSQANGDGLDVVLRFTDCRFLMQNAVAFLGGLARLIEHRGGRVCFEWDTVQDNIRTNLAQQGFLAMFGCPGGPWTGNSIPYREDQTPDKAGLMDYLKSKWLGRGWLSVSPILRNAIVGHVWEIYANAFEHGRSPIGVFSCGQHYPRLKRLDLAVVDFGVGIPSNVRFFVQSPDLAADHALRWAFQVGNTTRPNGMGRGMGLSLLGDFVHLNRGVLSLFSHDGYARIDEAGMHFAARESMFEGTLLNISLQCDDRYYCLQSEAPEFPLF